MIFESLRRLIVAVVYIVGLSFSFFLGIAGIVTLIQDGDIGGSVIFVTFGIVLVLLTFMVAKLVNWIFQHQLILRVDWFTIFEFIFINFAICICKSSTPIFFTHFPFTNEDNTVFMIMKKIIDKIQRTLDNVILKKPPDQSLEA